MLIGDVGFIADGRFARLLNAVRPADDPTNMENDVPGGFTVLRYECILTQTDDDYLGSHPIYSKFVIQFKGSGGVERDSSGLGGTYTPLRYALIHQCLLRC